MLSGYAEDPVNKSSRMENRTFFAMISESFFYSNGLSRLSPEQIGGLRCSAESITGWTIATIKSWRKELFAACWTQLGMSR